MNPDYGVARVYLGVKGPTARISNQSTLLEPENVHKKPLSSLNVLIHSQRDDAVGTPRRNSFLDFGRIQLCGGFYQRMGNLSIARSFFRAVTYASAIGVMADGTGK